MTITERAREYGRSEQIVAIRIYVHAGKLSRNSRTDRRNRVKDTTGRTKEHTIPTGKERKGEVLLPRHGRSPDDTAKHRFMLRGGGTRPDRSFQAAAALGPCLHWLFSYPRKVSHDLIQDTQPHTLYIDIPPTTTTTSPSWAVSQSQLRGFLLSVSWLQERSVIQPSLRFRYFSFSSSSFLFFCFFLRHKHSFHLVTHKFTPALQLEPWPFL